MVKRKIDTPIRLMVHAVVSEKMHAQITTIEFM